MHSLTLALNSAVSESFIGTDVNDSSVCLGLGAVSCQIARSVSAKSVLAEDAEIIDDVSCGKNFYLLRLSGR